MLIEERFEFTPFPFTNSTGAVDKVIDRPLIPIRINYPPNHRTSQIPVNCLLDSGADRNLFPAHWGESIGIKIKKGKKIIIGGIGNTQIEAFEHRIRIYCGMKISLTTFADFSYSQELPLLGRLGFFNHFKEIVFDEENSCVILRVKK